MRHSREYLRLQALGLMPFGKYKGLEMDDVPTDYLCFLLREGIAEKWTWLWHEITRQMSTRKQPTEYLLTMMDSDISDEEFGTIAAELNSRGSGTFPGWGIANTSTSAELSQGDEDGSTGTRDGFSAG